MAKGINLAETKSLADFDALLEKAIEAVSSKKLSVAYDLDEESAWKFQIGRYVEIDSDDEDEDAPLFWVGYGWDENSTHESMLWLEFDAKTCPEEYWNKIYNLVGTSGKYYSKIDLEFIQMYMNAWIHFYLGEKYLKRFYDENADQTEQMQILTGFIEEVLEKL